MNYQVQLQWLQQQLPLPLLVLFSTFLFAIIFFHRKPNSNVPPSPPKLPIIGNLHQLSSLPHRSLKTLSDKYGPIMLLRMGQIPTLVVSSPDLAKEVLRTHDHVFASRPKYKAAGILMYGQKNVSFAPYGDHWRKVKKICVAHLLNTRVVRSFWKIREEEVSRMIEKIRNSASAQGRISEPVVELSEIFYEFANTTVIRSATGAAFDDRVAMAKFKELVDEATTLLRGFQIDDVFPSLGWVGFFSGMDAKLKKMFGRWDEFLNGLVDGHQSGSGDFVDVLRALQKDPDSAGLELTKDDIKTVVMDMNAAGTDTTFVVLDWAMTELILNPQVMARAKQELHNQISTSNKKSPITEEDADGLLYLKAVIKETLRLHLPAPLLLPHESTEETTLTGYTIPKGTRIIVNAWAIARDPQYWDSPEEFVPERFLVDDVADYKGQDFRFLPFGSGRRICPGMQFAMVAVEVALANLLYCFDWSLPGGVEVDVDEVPGITIRREKPLRLVATNCRPLAACNSCV